MRGLGQRRQGAKRCYRTARGDSGSYAAGFAGCVTGSTGSGYAAAGSTEPA